MTDDSRVIEFLLDPARTTAWATGHAEAITGFSFKIRPDDVLMTVKRVLKGKAEVAFCSAETAADCIDLFLEGIEKRGGFRWQEDRWAKLAKK